jgi:hypothetical protein
MFVNLKTTERNSPMNTNPVFSFLAILILIAISVTNLYRAKTQSITCDEAYSYELWISQPLSRMYVAYDASNHVLQTLLSKISVAAFGASEFTLRLPTLLAGFLYFIAVYRLSKLIFGQGSLFLLSVSVLSLNPLLLDLLSAARGYGLALAFCAWALFYMVKGPPQSPYQMLRLAILLALSVSSNVTFLFIDAGLAALFVGTLLRDSRAAFRSLTYFIIPGIVLTLIIIGGPMRNTHSADFYFGLPSLARSNKSLVYISFVHRLTLPGIHYYYDALVRFVDFITAWFVPITLCLSGVVLLAVKKAFLIQPPDRFLFFSAGALLFSIGASYVVHRSTGLLYPISRTGLPWIVFFLLTCLALVKKPALRWPMLVFLLACALWFAFELNANQYTEWAYDAGTKRIVTLLRNQHQAEPDKYWQVGVSWILLPSMNFYKSLYHLNWFEPIDIRTGTAGLTRFVLVDKDVQLVQTLTLHTNYVDPVSGQVVATR